MQPTSARVLPLVLFLLAVAVRLPTLGLPLEGDSAVLASVGDRLGNERGTELAGQAPLMPGLVAVLVNAGVSATLALRWIDLVLAALLAPLVIWLGRRLGLRRDAAIGAGIVMAVHPLAFLEAGGLQPGGGALLAALVLAAVGGLSGGPVARRAGAAAALGATFAAAPGPLYGLLFFGHALYREDGRAARVVLLGAAVCAFSFLPLPRVTLEGGFDPRVGLWLLGAGLGVFWLGVPVGARRLRGAGPGARLWLVAAAVHVALLAFALSADAGVALLPLIALAGAQGLGEAVAAHRLMVRGAAILGLAGCLWLGMAPGRLHRLRDAMHEAARVAGSAGWIVLSVANELPDEQSSLADLQPRHWTWSDRDAPDEATETAVRRLLPFPAATFETGQRVAVVADAGTRGTVHTFGGVAIFHQEVVRQLGPFVVLRARRPEGTPERDR